MNNQITKSNCIYNLLFGITTFCTIISSTNLVSAQIIPDNTLPNNSQVGIEGNTTKIEGGTTAGGNLFHSFEKFGVTTGGEAHFNNAVDINNIITRVTGNSISEIDGLIKANGAANLFLINPNGIVFGENVKLDIGGSFVGSTADAIGFGEDNFFSASNPDSSSLLKVNPSALFFNQVKASSIESNSVAQEDLNSSGDNTNGFKGLRVPNGKSLLLVGGDIDIDIDGGRLWAFGGHIELGGLAGKGTIGLNLDEDGNNIRLSFPEGVEKSNVSLNKGMSVNVRDGDGGSIAVNARNLKMTDNSSLLAGIKKERGTDDSRAGDINVNVTDEINLNDGSLIDNRLLPKSKGQGGDININAGTLLVKNGAQVRTNNRSKGKGGNLTVNAQDVQLIGTNEKGRLSGLFSQTKADSTGDVGDVTINTSSLRLEDGGQVNTSTLGQGKGGNLTVNAEDIRLIGTNEYGRFSGLFAKSNSKGDGGDLTIKTNTLRVEDGAQVNISTFGQGKGGNLTVNALDVQLIGESKNRDLSGLFAQALKESTGNPGNVTINTNSLLVQDGARVSTSTINKEKGGNITVNAQDVQLIGKSNKGGLTGLAARANPKSTGDAGNVTINTDSLRLKDGGQVSVSTVGKGNAGNLTVNALDVELIGESSLFAQALENSSGDAGNCHFGQSSKNTS
ncbi:MAG: filamentous hemagglutinin N-terminal domain-containing protein [Cyanobacteriota bacterium]|nr:filamentous hemagglutinin N-terminal domain-containing protein [Cyanobacteriota bacterium]